MLPGAYLRELVELAARWGVSADALLAGTGANEAQLRDPATRLPLAACAEIIARALRLTGEPALALHLGLQMRLSSHGFVGFAALTASTVRDAIELATRYAATRTPAIGLALYVEGDTASLVISEREPLAPFGVLREFVVLGLLAGLWQLGEALTGQPLAGRAECAFPEPAFVARLPADSEPRARLRFAAPAHRLVFASALLAAPIRSADPVATELARAQCERELAAIVESTLVGRVRAAVIARAGAPPTIDELARALHLSTRTLKRRLAEHATTFTAIVDEVRHQRALLLLANRALSIGEVAVAVGYRELPSFTRAFRKWTGMTPAAYRRAAITG